MGTDSFPDWGPNSSAICIAIVRGVVRNVPGTLRVPVRHLQIFND